MINGVTKVVMTKADVLDNFTPLQVCTAYNADGEETKEVPFQMTRMDIKPVLQQFEGWNTDTSKCKEASEIPEKMSTYIDFINSYIGVPVAWVSNGPGRDKIIKM
jgi:adenylosuccinate synthase